MKAKAGMRARAGIKVESMVRTKGVGVVTREMRAAPYTGRRRMTKRECIQGRKLMVYVCVWMRALAIEEDCALAPNEHKRHEHTCDRRYSAQHWFDASSPLTDIGKRAVHAADASQMAQ